MRLQLNPAIPAYVIDKGKGCAWALIDDGPEHHLKWVVAMDKTGEIWTIENPLVRAQKNVTLGRLINEYNISTNG